MGSRQVALTIIYCLLHIKRDNGVSGVNGLHVQSLVGQEFNPELASATIQRSLSMASPVLSLNFKLNLVAVIIVSILLGTALH